MARRERIGLVEGSDDNRALIVELLIAEGLEVAAFERMDELIAHKEDVPMLAVADAWTVWHREDELCAVVPSHCLLVMTSAHRHAGVWRSLGATRILAKPFVTQDFLRNVRELAGRPAQSRQAP